MLPDQFVLRRKNSKATNTLESVFMQSSNDLFYQRLLTKNDLPETDRNQIDCKRKNHTFFFLLLNNAVIKIRTISSFAPYHIDMMRLINGELLILQPSDAERLSS